jgi:hypothetical protein
MITEANRGTPEKKGVGPLADFLIVSAGRLVEPIAHNIEKAITLKGIKPTIVGEMAEYRVVERIITSILSNSPSGVEDPINPLAHIDYHLKVAIYDELYTRSGERHYEGLTGRRNNIADFARVMTFRVWDKLVEELPGILTKMDISEKTIIENRSKFFSVLDNMRDWLLMKKSFWQEK